MGVNEDEQELINQFKKGDREAADKLIARYFDRVARTAEKKLKNRNLRVSGGDDVAVSVFDSLWQRASEKRFSDEDLTGPDELWRLLSKMVDFKTADHARRSRALKRGGGNVRGDSIFVNANDGNPGFGGVAGEELTAEQLCDLKESYMVLMRKLDSQDLQQVAVMRIEGYKVSEIAKHFDRSERWVKRKLALIRDIWARETEDQD